MSILKEWFCADHGEFECSHPICPTPGCESREVIREIRTAPGFKSDVTKRTDAGLRRTAQMYGQSNFRSAKEGESSKADNRANEMIWGLEAGAKVIGRPLTAAHVPTTYNFKDESGAPRQWTDRGALINLANEAGLTQRVLPIPAETISHMGDKDNARKIK
jgi:hypothetical protein